MSISGVLNWFEQLGERAAEAVIHESEAAVHFAEKEIVMTVSDIVAGIKAALSRANDQKANDAKTISDLQDANKAQADQITALQGQVTDLTTQLSDATAQLSDLLTQALAVAPDPSAVS